MRTLLILILMLCGVAAAQPITPYYPFWVDHNADGTHKNMVTVINVTDTIYGAGGDGIADDGPAVDLAFDAGIALGNAVIYFPEGNYSLATWSAITIASANISIAGAGADLVTITGPGIDGGANFLEVRDNLQIQGVTIKSFDTVLTCTTLATTIDRITLRDCRFEDFQYGMFFGTTTGGYADLLIDGCVFDDGNVGLWLTSKVMTNTTVTNTTFSNLSYKVAGMGVLGIFYGLDTTSSTDRGRLTVTDSHFVDIDGGAATETQGILAHEATDVLIANNHFRDIQRKAATTDVEAVYIRDVDQAIVASNTFVDCNCPEAVVDIKMDCLHAIVSHNIIRVTDADMIVNGIGVYNGNADVVGNKIIGVTRNPIIAVNNDTSLGTVRIHDNHIENAKGKYGIVTYQKYRRVDIQGNTIAGLSGADATGAGLGSDESAADSVGIFVAGSALTGNREHVIANNLITANGDGVTDRIDYGIQLTKHATGDMRNISVINNQIFAVNYGIVTSNGGIFMQITGNTIYDAATANYSLGTATNSWVVTQGIDGIMDFETPVQFSGGLSNGSTSGGYMDFLEDTDHGTNYIRFQAPGTDIATTVYTLPAADGTDGQVLKTNGSAVLSFVTPAGSGDMLQATYDADTDGDVDVAAGGTEKSSWTQYAIPWLSATTTFGEIAIGTAGQYLKVNATTNGYEWGTIAGGGDLVSTNNLSDVASATTSATNLGLGTGDSPQFTAVNIGAATDTTMERTSAGQVSVEGSGVVLDSDIGVTVQAYDADLTTFAAIAPSANIVSFLGAATYAAARALMDLEAGTDFYSISAADAAFQALNTVLTELTALTDPGANRISYWNDSTNNFEWLDYSGWDVTPYTGGDFLTLTAHDFDVDTAAVTNGDTTHLSTADAIYDWGVAAFQPISAVLSTYAGIDPSADVQTFLGYATFAAMKGGLSIDDIITLTGIAEGVTHLGTFTGTTIADNQSIKAALQALETAVELAGGHNAVTIGTANGLSLSTQVLSLAAATNATPGAMTAAQVTALEAVDTEAELEALLELADLQGLLPWTKLATTGTWSPTGTIDLSGATVTFGLEAGDIPDLSATYEGQLANEAGLYAALSDVTEFLETGDAGSLASLTLTQAGSQLTSQTGEIFAMLAPDGRIDLRADTDVYIWLDDDNDGSEEFRILAGDDAVVFTVSESGAVTTKMDPGDGVVTGLTGVFTAHENVVVGDACYINTDGEMQIGDADAIATSSCVALAGATIAADATGVFLLNGIACETDWTWTVGGLIYLTVTGTTTNTLSQTAPSGTDDVVQILGVATHADRILFAPQLVQVELE